jgi:tetratricopeptide (TPR) repeat protein
MILKSILIVMIVLVLISFCIFVPIVTATTAEEWNEQGFRFLESGDCEKAIECFDKAIGLNPNYTDAYLNRGLAYWYLKQNERAIEDFEKVIELNPCSDRACRALKFALSKLKQENGASEDYEFAAWAADKSHTWCMYCELKRSADKSNKVKTLELLWIEVAYFCQNALIEIDQFDVSIEMQPIKNEFRLFLQYLKLSAFYAESSFNSYDLDARANSIKYYDLAVEHHNNFSDLYENWYAAKTATPAPTPILTVTPAVPPPEATPTSTVKEKGAEYPIPGFEPKFGIAGLLVVAYFVLRLKR